ncbi:putative hydroxypyruvate isomerase isoform X1 [Bos javanicus]|uniref:putative hydroxypyruvate isomerase isoform X1 n=1 Tax=Bos javanicus TaxID=9906 RepID=UPI002AA938CA|nr:putative hydroxypyruvate isomerase isoform X1 [Bos javanicus]
MAPLRFSANLSWLFPELSGFPARLRAAGSSGFEAAEIGWPYAEPPEALARAAREAGLRVVLINTPPGDREKGENGLGAVPGRQAAFREGLEQAVLYAKALDCSRIHLMAGRVPKGADRAAVRSEMEIVFLENLRHAAEVLAQENLVGLLEPINTRITDPRYFLDTPQQAAAILQKVGRPNLQLQMDLFHWQIMDGNLTGNVREFLPIVGEGPFLGFFLVCDEASSVLPLSLPQIYPQGTCRWHRSRVGGNPIALESSTSPICSNCWKMKATQASWAASTSLEETQQRA